MKLLTEISKTFIVMLLINSTICNDQVTDLQLLILHKFVNGSVAFPECMRAIDFVIETTNRNNRILPNYNLVMQKGNEGHAAIATNKAVVDFWRSNENKHIAPAIIGPFYACHIAGRLVKSLNFIQFSPLCHGKFIVENRKNFALFSAQGSVKSKFIIERFLQAHWKEFAVVTHKENRNAYEFANDLLELTAERSNIKQVFYASDQRGVSDKTMLALKKSKARIIVIAHGMWEVCLQFFCKAYHLGMTPPRYFFIVTFFPCLLLDVRDSEMPANCTREQLDFQRTAVIADGVLSKALELDSNFTSPLGYTYQEVDEKFDLSTKLMRKQRNFLTCHDAAMAAVLTLHKTDKELLVNYNLTLLSFHNNASLIQKVMNQSAMNVRFNSFRVGDFKFNPETGYISEDVFLAQATEDGNKMKLVYKLPVRDHGVNASLIMINEMKWPTPNGKPVKDLSDVLITYQQCYFVLTLIIFPLIAIFITIIQLTIFVSTVWKNKSSQAKEITALKTTLGIGCICLNLGAIWNLIGKNLVPQVECLTSPIFPCLGIGLLTSTLFLLVLSIHSSRSPKSSFKPTNSHIDSVLIPNTDSVIKVFIRPMAPLTLICCFLLLWILLQPLKTKRIESDEFYDEKADQYRKNVSFICGSETAVVWILNFLCSNFLLLLSCALMVQQMAKLGSKRWKLNTKFNLLYSTTVSVIAILLAACLILPIAILLAGQCIQQYFFACFLLLLSIAGTPIFFTLSN